MSTPPSPNHYKSHRFPAEIISHAVWLYFRFCLSFCDVEEVLFARGVVVTYEAIRQWCRKFGQPYANQLRHRRPRPSDKWHLAEVCLTIKGDRHDLWRAVAQEGQVLDILVQRRRDKRAAKKFFRKLLKGLTDVPRALSSFFSQRAYLPCALLTPYGGGTALIGDAAPPSPRGGEKLRTLSPSTPQEGSPSLSHLG
jgi:putative transposase